MNVIEPLFAAAIGNTNLAYDSANNYFQIRCSMAQQNITLQFMMSPSANVTDTPVVLNVAIADVIYPMDSDYMSSASVCMIGIVPTTGQIFFGESILRSLYQVYDVDQNRIGIASAIGSDSFISGATGTDASSNGGSSGGSNNSNSNSNNGSNSAGASRKASILGSTVISACILYALCL
ncbi:hypothetical protein MUCCIDRAFT_156411 [Mucor lusitanicus CBS 277.49]|uniref:Peptidase A1 domain-containing protein n=2 Tax=Mucor circinelloides f. lusitanicus TaxID=29924 RepID=A0A168K519_MUCCL|nr:hypothetical protein MUCCIDRAFT_156411 [Mucor lusitanicus CBS 277.49]